MDHTEIIKFIIAYTFTGVLVITAAFVTFSMVGWIKFSDKSQQKKLFNLLIVEIIAVGIGFYADFMRFNPSAVIESVVEQANDISIAAPKGYAAYTNRAAGLGFAYPEDLMVESKGIDIHHGQIKFDDAPSHCMLYALTFIPTDAEYHLREQQGKSNDYYLKRHVQNYCRTFPFIKSGAVIESTEDYLTPVGMAKIVALNYVEQGLTVHVRCVFIYTDAHKIHTFTLEATDKSLDFGRNKLRNIISSIVVN